MTAPGTAPRGYYVPLGADDGWEHLMPTAESVSVWTDTIQHGGPPSALMVRAIENLDMPAHLAMSRVTVDILGAIGLSENRVRAQVIRPGRQIAQVQAELDVQTASGDFRTAARATAWLIATSDTAAVAAPVESPSVPAAGDDTIGELPTWLDAGWGASGFISTVEFRASTDPDRPRLAWLRPAVDIVAGETATPLVRTCCMVDVANGLGSTLSPSEWTWMNTDTTIHLRRAPTGDWTGIDAAMVGGAHGFGYTAADLFDDDGSLGRSSQTILITRAG
ncbi:hypothetical protein ASG12_09190 [Williamsia sp. Leaf354]|uniref:thioesterase family protein n=1 Tax=Williamsia sp. Leaf354 TaxID=1736349 RepID=UPI0006F72727|nr:thioesterase family protein [Williamsia sp. Leaf354]KQR98591.1 hypothetical protein ASG12_09190 [Williamsia sp. Leaf354]